ncbi:hypothetical protein F0L74_03370 [Chitinophaga agrisoli]|uniref:VCBS repeat protein n=1 Tax=Chitinophaga agrisoli TaxID=2607653 RepID=A0A5B2VYS8_9BACT|nr:hypothetical protein [Chitinophaga agrisoli]KAA2245013.1 hypothetical protein F0L74_03370 [Chitinophaga agrisoli]
MRTKALLGALAIAMFLMTSCSKEGAKESTTATTNTETSEEKVRALHYVVDEKGVSALVDDTTLVPAHPPQPQTVATVDKTVQQTARMLDVPPGANIGFDVLSKNSDGTYACRVLLYTGADVSYAIYKITDGNLNVLQDLHISGLIHQPDPAVTIVIDFNMAMPCGHTYDVAVKTVYGSGPVTLYSQAYWFGYNFITTQGLGDNADGADVKITDINGNGIPDIFLMANDDPSGGNTFRYKFLMDVNANGVPAATLPERGRACNCNDAEGAGAAFGDINRDGKVDMVLMAVDAQPGLNKFRYQIGFGMNANGEPDSWQTYNDVDGIGNDGMDGGVALADIDKNGILDIVFMGLDGINATTGYEIRYKVGFNLGVDGRPTNWGPMQIIDLPNINQVMGAGIDIADLHNNGTPTMAAFYYELRDGKRYFTTIITDMTLQGEPVKVNFKYPIFQIDPVGEQAQGAGVAIGDLDRDGKKDMILMANDNPSGANSFRYYMLFGIRFDYAPEIRFTRAACTY